MSEMGPVVQQLGSIRQTAIGRVTMYVTIAMGVVGLMMAAVGVFLVVVGLTFSHFLLLGIFGFFVLFLSVVDILFAITMIMQLSGTVATIHEGGMTLGQSWFRKAQIPWAEVVRIEPPTGGSGWVRFDVLLRSGHRVCVDRLRLKPIMGTAGMQHHPDVQAALNHYTAWQQRYGSTHS